MAVGCVGRGKEVNHHASIQKSSIRPEKVARCVASRLKKMETESKYSDKVATAVNKGSCCRGGAARYIACLKWVEVAGPFCQPAVAKVAFTY